jgi:hypothetical protein
VAHVRLHRVRVELRDRGRTERVAQVMELDPLPLARSRVDLERANPGSVLSRVEAPPQPPRAVVLAGFVREHEIVVVREVLPVLQLRERRGQRRHHRDAPRLLPLRDLHRPVRVVAADVQKPVHEIDLPPRVVLLRFRPDYAEPGRPSRGRRPTCDHRVGGHVRRYGTSTNWLRNSSAASVSVRVVTFVA